MSSQSSDDIMAYGVCSQNSNANVAPSCSQNTPFPQFASLCLADYDENLLRWRPQVDSDYYSDYDKTNGKRKQRSDEPKTDVQQKKRKIDEEMDCEEESQVQSEKSDAYEVCEADNEEEEESMEECSEKCDGACGQDPDIFRMNDEPLSEPDLITSIIQPSTSGMKRKNSDQLESPTVPKVKRSS